MALINCRQGQEKGEPPMSMTTTKTSNSEEARIRAAVAERIAALHDKDAPRLAATYAPEIVKFGLAPPLQVVGSRVAEPAYWQPWLESWTDPITLDVTELDGSGRDAADLQPEASHG
jgi:ketosteroid isomerase-like protein